MFQHLYQSIQRKTTIFYIWKFSKHSFTLTTLHTTILYNHLVHKFDLNDQNTRWMATQTKKHKTTLLTLQK